MWVDLKMIPTQLFYTFPPNLFYIFCPTWKVYSLGLIFYLIFLFHVSLTLSQQKQFLSDSSFPQAKWILSRQWNIVEYVDLREIYFLIFNFLKVGQMMWILSAGVCQALCALVLIKNQTQSRRRNLEWASCSSLLPVLFHNANRTHSNFPSPTHSENTQH